jgi:hypothetical protein
MITKQQPQRNFLNAGDAATESNLLYQCSDDRKERRAKFVTIVTL